MHIGFLGLFHARSGTSPPARENPFDLSPTNIEATVTYGNRERYWIAYWYHTRENTRALLWILKQQSHANMLHHHDLIQLFEDLLSKSSGFRWYSERAPKPITKGEHLPIIVHVVCVVYCVVFATHDGVDVEVHLQ